MNLWKADPRFTNYVPKTAVEAVERYVRCRNNGVSPMMIPECLIQCAAGLSEPELDRFEKWVINPQADLSDLDIVESNEIGDANHEVWCEAVDRVNAKMDKADPCVWEVTEKLKSLDTDDEKMQD